MLNASLGFLGRGAATKRVRQVCRICHEIAELKTEELCPDCVWVKAQIRLRIPQQPPRPSTGGDSSKQDQQCKRSGCLCLACSRRILDPHPLHLSDPTRARGREIHLHPRCQALWLDTGGADAQQGDTSDPTTTASWRRYSHCAWRLLR
jgi:hypothetical protein